jgi:NhaA family Na+:H+ antiporter
MTTSSNKTPIEKLTYPLQQFLHQQTSGGILLIVCTIIALVWANSPLAESYHHLWQTNLSIAVHGVGLSYSIHHWINDGLMVVFFFVVGLEIKRELIAGELSSAQKAALPIAAAIGGMIFPAVLYTFFNFDSSGSSGWGIPMATDIAFVVGILALLGKKVPLALKIFVLALAIVDDIGAVLVIAVFYTSGISIISLMIAGGLILILIIMNRMGVRNLLIYSLVGVALWLAFLKSGVHATVAGVLFAFTIPASSRINTKVFSNVTHSLVKDFDKAGDHGDNVLTNDERLSIVDKIENNCKKILTPLQRFEHGLHPWVSFLIMPIFALSNAGVSIVAGLGSALTSPISLGIIIGLFFGKQIGIFSFSYLAIKLGIATKPKGVCWKNIYGAAILAGIGFTMSLFIANLAFSSKELLNIAKVGILAGSLISGIVGFIFLKSTLNSIKS